MPNYIQITSGNIQVKAEIYDTTTAQAIIKDLPIESHVNRWGGEIYFTETAKAALGQKMCIESSVVFIWTAIFQRMEWKYDQRAYRYIYLDAGHIAENLALTATSLDLGSCQIGALYDDEVNKIISVDGTDESVIYMSVIGIH